MSGVPPNWNTVSKGSPLCVGGKQVEQSFCSAGFHSAHCKNVTLDTGAFPFPHTGPDRLLFEWVKYKPPTFPLVKIIDKA